MIQTVDLKGRTYNIKPCTDDDVLRHYKSVSTLIGDDDPDAYIQRMHECVAAGTAFSLEDDSCFLYYLNYRPALAYGYAFYGRGNPHKTIALIMGIFHKIDPLTFSIKFTAHNRFQFVHEFKSILTPTSIRIQSQNNGPLHVRVDLLKKRWVPLAEKRGLSWEA